MRGWIFRLLVVAFLWLVASRFAEVEKLAQVILHGNWAWVAVAIALQVAYHAAYTGLYVSAFHTVGVRSRFRDLWPVTLGSLFVNVVAPAGGTTGAALFVDDAARRGESAAKAAAGTLLLSIAEFGTFIGLLAVGMVYLFRQHDLTDYEIATAALFVAVMLGLGAVMLIGLLRPTWLGLVLSALHRVAARVLALIGRPSPLDAEWAGRTATEFGEAAFAIKNAPVRLARTILIALGCHLIDLACLFTVFLAFDQPVGFGALFAGYSMAILFWIASPTPQGVGVVEAVTAMVFASLGVPGSKAIVIALAFRGVTFWLPLLVGMIVLKRISSFKTQERTQAKVAELHLAAAATAAIGLINLLSGIMPALADRLVILEPVLTAGARHGARLASVVAGFALMTLSRGLWRRKRVAWMISMGLLSISLLAHLLKGLDYEEAAVVFGAMLWLWSLRDHYHAPSDPPSIRQALIVLAGAVIFTFAYGSLGFFLLDRQFAINYNFSAASEQTLIMFTGFYNPNLEPITGFGRYFADSIYLVGAFSFGYGLVLLLRPVFLRKPATLEERARAQAIVEANGRSSLASAALLPDKSYFFSSGGSVIAFVARSGIGLALGDPIGPEPDASEAIVDFREHCASHDWAPAFYQTLPDYIGHYRAAGFSVLAIGHEAIVDVQAFSLEGGERKSIRTSVNRLARLGFEALVCDPPIPDEALEELRLVSDEWLTMMHGSEKRFSLGWFDDDYIRSCPVMAIRSSEGAVVAFANIISEYQRNECTVDLMRRTKDAPSGTMDFLFVKLFEWANQAGFDTFNLGLSPLSGVGEKPGDPAIERAVRFIYDHANQFYSFRGLHQFKEKFGPEWSPRYLVYNGSTNLLRTAYAIISADSGGSLISSYLRRA